MQIGKMNQHTVSYTMLSYTQARNPIFTEHAVITFCPIQPKQAV